MANPLRNKKVLITAGPTREYWDPVRFLTNASSGSMGIALANEAARSGAQVTLVLGPVEGYVSGFGFRVPGSRKRETRNAKPGTTVKVVPIVSAWDMYKAVKKNLTGTDVFVGTAAVLDYRPTFPVKHKIKRHDASLSLRLSGNPDIIAMVGHLKKDRPGSVIGFALETDDVIKNAQKKLLHKRLDWILANNASNMGQFQGGGTLLSRWGHKIQFAKMPKAKLAQKMWKAIYS